MVMQLSFLVFEETSPSWLFQLCDHDLSHHIATTGLTAFTKAVLLSGSEACLGSEDLPQLGIHLLLALLVIFFSLSVSRCLFLCKLNYARVLQLPSLTSRALPQPPVLWQSEVPACWGTLP